MALTRKFLTALGIEGDKIDEIINAHVETVDALKEERNTYKAEAEQLKEVTKERDNLKKELDAKAGDEDFKAKYNTLKTEYDNYKTEQENKTTAAKKEAAYRELLKNAGVSEKRLNAVLKVSDLSNIKLDNEGKIEDADSLTKSIRDEWADFIVTEGARGADTKTPPSGNGGKMSKEDIMKITDTTERQKAIAENHEVFGI